MNLIEIKEKGVNKQVLPEVTGNVEAVWPKAVEMNKFNGEEESKQFVLLNDGTATIGLQLINKPEIFQGDTLTLLSTSSKHGLNGVSVNRYVSKKDNEEKVLIKVTNSGNVQKGQNAGTTTLTGAYKKADYTPDELLDLFNYWMEKTKDPGASAKLVGCSMVINHKVGPDAQDITGTEKSGSDDSPSFSDEDIPF